MKISKRTQYGLKAMVYLADCWKKNKNFCSLKEISESQKIPFDYSEKILTKLEKRDLVRSKRGIQGGYSLSLSPEEITVGEVIKNLENTSAIVRCISSQKGEKYRCPQRKGCRTRDVWKEIQKVLNETLDSITLADLIKE